MKRLRKVSDITPEENKGIHGNSKPPDTPRLTRVSEIVEVEEESVSLKKGGDVRLHSDDGNDAELFTTRRNVSSPQRRLVKLSDFTKSVHEKNKDAMRAENGLSDSDNDSNTKIVKKPADFCSLKRIKRSARSPKKRRLLKVSDLNQDRAVEATEDSVSEFEFADDDVVDIDGVSDSNDAHDESWPATGRLGSSSEESPGKVFSKAMLTYEWIGQWWMNVARTDDVTLFALSMLKSSGLVEKGPGEGIAVLSPPDNHKNSSGMLVPSDSFSHKHSTLHTPCGCDILSVLALHNALKCLEIFGNLQNGISVLLNKCISVVRELDSAAQLSCNFDDIGSVDLSPSRQTNKLLTQPSHLGSTKCKSLYMKHTESFLSALYLAYKLNHDMAVRIICRSFVHYAYTVLSSPVNDADDIATQGGDVSLFFYLARCNAFEMARTMLCAMHTYSQPRRRGDSDNNRPSSLVHALIEQRASDDKSTVMHWATEEGNLEFVRVLLKFCPQIGMCRDVSRVTPLHSACLMGRTDIAKLLLSSEYDVDADAVDATGWTPFMYAVHAEHEECALLVFRKSKTCDMDQICSLEVAISDPERMEAVLSALATIPDFFSLLNESLRENIHYLQGKLQFLLEYPFLLDVDNRLAVAKTFVESTLDSHFAEAALSIIDPESPVVIHLQREHAWIAFLHALNSTDMSRSTARYGDSDSEDDDGGHETPCSVLQRRVLFQFLGESGIGQGVERELFEILSKDIVSSPHQSQPLSSAVSDAKFSSGQRDNLFSLVEGSSANVCVPSAFLMSVEKQPQRTLVKVDPAYFEFGQLVGHLLLRRFRNPTNAHDSAVLSVNISEVFWKLVREESITLHDVASVDSVLYKNLQWLLSNDGASALDLSFTGSSPDGRVVDLKKNGSKISVTDKNKQDYVRLLIQHTIVDRMALQAEQTHAGIRTIIPQRSLDLFSGADISLLVTGVVELDVHEWKIHTLYSGYDNETIVIKWFWDFVESLDTLTLSLLLRFCTGCTRLPTGGFGSIYPKFNIAAVPYQRASSLPTAATCFNLLRLPRYPDKASLRKNLHVAIVHGSEGFSFA